MTEITHKTPTVEEQSDALTCFVDNLQEKAKHRNLPALEVRVDANVSLYEWLAQHDHPIMRRVAVHPDQYLLSGRFLMHVTW